MSSPWSQFSSPRGKSWSVQGAQETHEVTDLYWRGCTATGAAQAPGSCPQTTLTLDMAPPLSGLESAAGLDNTWAPVWRLGGSCALSQRPSGASSPGMGCEGGEAQRVSRDILRTCKSPHVTAGQWWGWWKNLVLLGLKIAQGRRVRNPTRQASDLDAGQHVHTMGSGRLTGSWS